MNCTPIIIYNNSDKSPSNYTSTSSNPKQICLCNIPQMQVYYNDYWVFTRKTKASLQLLAMSLVFPQDFAFKLDKAPDKTGDERDL